MIDKIIAVIAIASLVLFIAIIAIWVPEPDLIIICAICMAMACFDFYRMLVIVPRKKAAENAKKNS